MLKLKTRKQKIISLRTGCIFGTSGKDEDESRGWLSSYLTHLKAAALLQGTKHAHEHAALEPLGLGRGALQKADAGI